MKLNQLVAVVFTSALAFPAPCATSVDLVATEFDVPTRFFRINPDTAQATQIGTTRFVPGLDFRQDGVLYGSSSSLYTVSALDGTAATLGALPDLLVSIAFSPGDRLYGVSNDGLTLYQIDPNTGKGLSSISLTGTVHASGTPFPGEINGIDFGPDGTLYGIGFGLYTIDPLTGLASRITPLGQSVSGQLFGDLDFGADGKLRAPAFDSPSSLYVIDPVSGLGQLVGSMGVDITGLASVPEPSTYSLLIAGGLLVFLGSKWRTRRAVGPQISACTGARR